MDRIYRPCDIYCCGAVGRAFRSVESRLMRERLTTWEVGTVPAPQTDMQRLYELGSFRLSSMKYRALC